ncbi:MAG: right-handed parallel beta-helix repeat-containing protein, partial [Planctomycetes bacterium]|nr:right-handed parallel beta-helix repeat-containing protein [Planctomycetota bacterium]
SYANNNCFESWGPGNTYIRNKANHCSFGFWLGGSDHTVLIGNEAGWNGRPDGFHNAPEPDFVHGGIVIVGGSGTHTVIDGNYCHDNNGAGIVFRGDLGTRGAKWKMYHLIVQNSRLENNRWGLFARFADWLDLAGNSFRNNEKDELIEEVTHLNRRDADPAKQSAPEVTLAGPDRARVGQTVVFDASASRDSKGRPLTFRWDIGGTEYRTARVEHRFSQPGFCRVGVTATNGYLAGLAFRDVYVTENPRAMSDEPASTGPADEVLSESSASQWAWALGDNAEGRGRVHLSDDPEALVGRTSLRLRPVPYPGSEATVTFPKNRQGGWNLAGSQHLAFWLKFRNPNNGGFQGPNPIVRLHRGLAAFTYTPAFAGMPRNLLNDLPYSEARHGWLYVRIPLQGGDDWLRSETVEGAKPPHVDHDLKFETVETPLETQTASAMVSDGRRLYCATWDGDALLASQDGRQWNELAGPSTLGGAGPDWINGMLAYEPGPGGRGRLILRRRTAEKDAFNNDQSRVIAYDIQANRWSWLPTVTAFGHGAAIAGDYLFGIAHAVGGNYGGPIGRVNLSNPGPLDEHTVLAPVKGKDAWWFSRAAQLAYANGLIYAIKNDWQTPQPADPDQIGDRLLCFRLEDYKASAFAGGNRWKDSEWTEARTKVRDLGPLPFEVGHGAALVALPPEWCRGVGERGGLFIVAGCSPSNHEGYGPASGHYAIYDIAGGRFTVGVLPEVTGSGTSAALHRGRLY